MLVLSAAIWPSGTLPAAAKPDPFLSEAKRLLTLAAGHATYSRACVDGPGGDIPTVSDVTLTLEPATGDAAARTGMVRYRVTLRTESDTRGPAGIKRKPPGPPKPRTSSQTTQLTFLRGPDGYLLEVPSSLPGLVLLTPLDRSHDARCHGKKPAWRARPIAPPSP